MPTKQNKVGRYIVHSKRKPNLRRARQAILDHIESLLSSEAVEGVITDTKIGDEVMDLRLLLESTSVFL